MENSRTRQPLPFPSNMAGFTSMHHKNTCTRSRTGSNGMVGTAKQKVRIVSGEWGRVCRHKASLPMPTVVAVRCSVNFHTMPGLAHFHSKGRHTGPYIGQYTQRHIPLTPQFHTPSVLCSLITQAGHRPQPRAHSPHSPQHTQMYRHLLTHYNVCMVR